MRTTKSNNKLIEHWYQALDGAIGVVAEMELVAYSKNDTGHK